MNYMRTEGYPDHGDGAREYYEMEDISKGDFSHRTLVFLIKIR